MNALLPNGKWSECSTGMNPLLPKDMERLRDCQSSGRSGGRRSDDTKNASHRSGRFLRKTRRPSSAPLKESSTGGDIDDFQRIGVGSKCPAGVSDRTSHARTHDHEWLHMWISATCSRIATRSILSQHHHHHQHRQQQQQQHQHSPADHPPASFPQNLA